MLEVCYAKRSPNGVDDQALIIVVSVERLFKLVNLQAVSLQCDGTLKAI